MFSSKKKKVYVLLILLLIFRENLYYFNLGDWISYLGVMYYVVRQWVDEDVPEKVKANVSKPRSHQHVKVVELIGFKRCRQDIKLGFIYLNLLRHSRN